MPGSVIVLLRQSAALRTPRPGESHLFCATPKQGMNLALAVMMANPAEQATSGVVDTSGPTPATLKGLSGVFKNLLAEHSEAFVLVKQLGMRSEAQRNADVEPSSCVGPGRCVEAFSHERGEMAQGYAALRALVQNELLVENDADASDLADAMAALDAINPGSPEWGPTFLQVSELLEAHAQDESEVASTSDDHRQLQAAS